MRIGTADEGIAGVHITRKAGVVVTDLLDTKNKQKQSLTERRARLMLVGLLFGVLAAATLGLIQSIFA